ncbi:MAG: sulfite exporter TauE/SafE family protein [Syntrophomonas sp.]
MQKKELVNKYAFIIVLLAAIITALVWTVWGKAPEMSGDGSTALTICRLLKLIAVGLLAGYFGGLLGIGGGIIMLPILTFWLDFPTTLAVGTTLFAVIFTGISGGYAHLARGNADIQSTLYLGTFGVAGILLGSYLFTILASQIKILGLILGIFFIFPGIFMLWEALSKRSPFVNREKRPEDVNKTGLATLGFTVGFLTGILGLGGGYLLVPGLTYLFGYPLSLAVGTSLTTVVPLTIVGGSIKLLQQYVMLQSSLSLATGTIIGAQIGAASIKLFKPSTLKIIFSLYFIYTAVKFITGYWSQ